MDDAFPDSSQPRDLVARLWRRCSNAARALVPGRRTSTDANSGAHASPRNLAGRWPDAASLLAHRLNALDPEARPPVAAGEDQADR